MNFQDAYLVSFVLHAVKSKKLENDLYPISYFAIPLIELGAFTLLFYIFMDSMLIRWGIVFAFEIVMLFKEWKRIVLYFPKLDFKK